MKTKRQREILKSKVSKNNKLTRKTVSKLIRHSRQKTWSKNCNSLQRRLISQILKKRPKKSKPIKLIAKE